MNDTREKFGEVMSRRSNAVAQVIGTFGDTKFKRMIEPKERVVKTVKWLALETQKGPEPAWFM